MSKLSDLSPGLRKIAIEELNEVEERTPADLKALRDWLITQPHINSRTDDRFLLAFLRGSKFSLEKTKSKIDWYYTIHSMVPDIFFNSEINDRIETLMKSGFVFSTYIVYVRLPNAVGIDGPRIQFTVCKNLDFDKCSMHDLVRYERMVTQSQFFEDDNCIISGLIEILDVANVSFKLLKNFDFVIHKKMIIFAEKAMPARLKSIHLVNFPKEYYAIVDIAKALMSEKLKKRFYLHKNIDELCEVIPRKYLPKEYGGENGSIPEIQAEAERIIRSYDYKYYEKFRVDEKLRPIRKLEADEVFGIEGSFRKLDID